MASKTFTKEERSKHIESIRKQLKYLEDAERRLKKKLPTEEEKELMEEATNMQKSVGYLKYFFKFYFESGEENTKRLQRAAYEIRAQRSRTELFKSKDVELVQSHHNSNEIRIVLNGKSGKGKSALANNLLRFDHFKSEVSIRSITQACGFAIRYLVDGFKMLVIDTPGLFDTDKPDNDVQKEIMKCVALAAPGPNIFIFVVSVERFTPEEMKTLTNLQKLFGEKVIDHVIIVFTRKDNLPKDKMKFMKDVDGILLDLLVKCNFRFAFINNKADPDEIRVDIDVIMDLIFGTIAENNGAFYTNEEINAADKVLKGMIKEKNKNNRKEIRKLKEEKNGLIQTLILYGEPSSRESMIGQTDQKWGKETQDLAEEPETRKQQSEPSFEDEEDKMERIDKRTGSGPDSIIITNTPIVNTNNDVVRKQLEKIEQIMEEVKSKTYIEVKQDIEKNDDTVNTFGQQVKTVLGVGAGIAAGAAAGAAAVVGATLIAARGKASLLSTW